eukprot:TRINITY_DN20234_c0_g1_i2.p1 TRINITY_DN20234_c0_g1~~TRINITY_DN20234_c0_g1_i2.p1  ORF type:complete len:235 (-),score=38.25 TRINITY_DN20234_c0_g1_i2:26-730(-)
MRTKQSARKSVGGKFPNLVLNPRPPKVALAAPAERGCPASSVWESPLGVESVLKQQKQKWRTKRPQDEHTGSDGVELAKRPAKKRSAPVHQGPADGRKSLRNVDFEDGPRPCKWGCGKSYRNINVLSSHQSRCPQKAFSGRASKQPEGATPIDPKATSTELHPAAAVALKKAQVLPAGLVAVVEEPIAPKPAKGNNADLHPAAAAALKKAQASSLSRASVEPTLPAIEAAVDLD